MMNIVGTLLMSMSLFIVSRGYLGQIKGITKWAVASLIQSLGWIILSVLRDKVPEIISVVFGNGLVLLCLGLYFNILAEFNNQKIRRGWIYLLVGFEACLLAYFVLITPHVSVRIAIISGFSSLLMLSSSYILFFKSHNRPASNLLTATMFTICGIILAARCFYSLFVAPDPAQLPFGVYPMQNISYLTFYITSIMLTFGFVLMCNDRYINDRKLLEDALAESEEKFRKLLETAPDAMVIVDSKGKIKLINLQTEKLFGYTKDELLGKEVELLIPSHHIKGHRSHSEHFFAHPQTRTMGVGLNLRGKHKNGTEIPVEISLSPLKTADGIWVSAAIRDISERKKAEEKLIKNEKQLNDAQQLAKIGSWEFNLITFDLTWSIEHYRIFELEETPPDKLYDAYRSKIHPDDIKMLDTVVNNAIELGEGFNYEHRVICNNGTIKYVIGIGRTIRDEQGKPIELRGTVQDITQRKKAEEALKASEAKFSLLAKNATDIVSLHDLNFNYIYVSDSVKRNLGYEPEELIGKSALDFIHPKDLEYVKQRYSDMFNRNSIQFSQFRNKKKDGSYCWVESAGNFTYNKEGKITGLTVNTRDISERKQVEELLIKNEKQLNDAQQLAKIGSWEFIFATLESTWSKELYQISELEGTPSDMLFKAYRKKIHPDDITMLDTVVKNAIEFGERFNFEHRVMCTNKNIKYVIGIGNAIKNEQGKTIGLRGTIQDITQRKKAEDILRQSELRYRTLAEASEDMIYIISPKGIIDYLNDFAVRQFGKASDALVGKQMADLFPPEIANRQWENIQKVFKSGQSTYVEDQTILGGHLKFLGTNLVALRDRSENITSVMGVARDITERINAENILKENEIFISNIIENIPIGIFVKDADEFRYLRINKATEELIGVSRNELINKNDYDFFTKPEADFFTSKDKEALNSNQLIDIPEEIIQTKFHGERIVHVQKISILDNNGKPKYILGIAQDITEKKRSEQELIIAKNIAEELAGAKDRFLSNMSHEIRTPLNGIIGFTNVLLQSDLPPKEKKQIEIIKTSGNILMALINDILDLAKINDGKIELEESEFNLAELINDILISFELRIDEKDLKMFSKYDKNIPNLLIGDPIRISQILINLINNSKKFTNNGGQINVNVILLEEDHENAIIEFSITDTGIGIPKEKLKTIFEPFVQVDNDTHHNYEGTGLGLSIVKRLVGLMNGAISINSEVNKGSTISFTIPLKKTTAIEVSTKKDVPLLSDDLAKIGHLKVLIADDNEINQLLAQTILLKFGFEMDSAENGQIAIELLNKNQYDIILMDLKMPEMGGFEATHYIRTQMLPPKSTIPIIAITADVTKADLETFKEAGINDFILKPFDQTDLLNKIISLVKKT
ncbi:MAG: PAS domain S-box protein [Bacteroidota bacterium]|nr:PAS domain S-box protein [Bacteroidota bacterium]